MRQIYVETDRRAYESFVDENWTAQLMGGRIDGTLLEQPVIDLVFGLRMASTIHSTPLLIVRTMMASVQDTASARVPIMVRWSRGLREHLLTRLDGAEVKLSERQRRGVAVATAQIAREATEAEVTVNATFVHDNVDAGWNEYMKPDSDGRVPLSVPIIASQRQAFVAQYFAYEDFVANCLRIAEGKPEKRYLHTNAITESLKLQFGEECAEFVFNSPGIVRARNVRNSITHNGGRETPALKNDADHCFKILDGKLCITAMNNHQLFRVLAPRVDRLIDETMAKLEG